MNTLTLDTAIHSGTAKPSATLPTESKLRPRAVAVDRVRLGWISAAYSSAGPPRRAALLCGFPRVSARLMRQVDTYVTANSCVGVVSLGSNKRRSRGLTYMKTIVAHLTVCLSTIPGKDSTPRMTNESYQRDTTLNRSGLTHTNTHYT
jgi:hypothetical protein